MQTYPQTNQTATPEQRVPTRVEHYAGMIRERTAKSVEAVIEIGRVLAEAKADLGNADWLSMVETDLGWKRSTAYALMKIAANPVLAASDTVGRLPASWGTLELLSKLEPEVIETAIERGEIMPSMTRADAARLVPSAPRKRSSRAPAPPPHRYLPRSQWPTAQTIAREAVSTGVYMRNRMQLLYLRDAEPALAPAIGAFEEAIERANKVIAEAGEKLIDAAKNASATPIKWPPKPKARATLEVVR